MKFSFGIVTDGNQSERLNKIIDSIEMSTKDEYEIVIIGGEDIYRKNTKVLRFNENTGPARISEKKNIITNEAKYENIVYLHDYISLTEDWYSGFLKFGDNFDICMTKIENTDFTRYRDWCLWVDDAKKFLGSNNYLIPYNIRSLSKMMYISGAYWVAKKRFMMKNKLNEKLKWGQGEDVEWSIRVRKLTDFSLNENSTVRLLKHKDRIFNEMTKEDIDIVMKLDNYSNKSDYEDLVNNHLLEFIRN